MEWEVFSRNTDQAASLIIHHHECSRESAMIELLIANTYLVCFILTNSFRGHYIRQYGDCYAGTFTPNSHDGHYECSQVAAWSRILASVHFVPRWNQLVWTFRSPNRKVGEIREIKVFHLLVKILIYRWLAAMIGLIVIGICLLCVSVQFACFACIQFSIVYNFH